MYFDSMYVCAPMHSVCQVRSEENTRFLGTGLADVCEPPCGFWQSNSGSLKQVFLGMLKFCSLWILLSKVILVKSNNELCKYPEYFYCLDKIIFKTLFCRILSFNVLTLPRTLENF